VPLKIKEIFMQNPVNLGMDELLKDIKANSPDLYDFFRVFLDNSVTPFYSSRTSDEKILVSHDSSDYQYAIYRSDQDKIMVDIVKITNP
jgi:hypothetical protein